METLSETVERPVVMNRYCTKCSRTTTHRDEEAKSTCVKCGAEKQIARGTTLRLVESRNVRIAWED